MDILRWRERLLLTALALIIVLFFDENLCAQSRPSEQDSLHFHFGALALLNNQKASKLVPLASNSTLTTGDRIKFFLETSKAAFFYIFHHGPDGALSLLFPLDLKKAKMPAGERAEIPEATLWFELDTVTGVEKFFLLASSSRLLRLEDLWARHTNLKDRFELSNSTRSLMAEIARLNKQSSSLTAAAEKPVRLAGKVRTLTQADPIVLPENNTFAEAITAQGFYGKTFTIEHR